MKYHSSLLLCMIISTLSACGQAPAEKPYVYELVTLNVGKKKIIGVELYYGEKYALGGALTGESKQTSTIGFFETPIPYPTKIEYEFYGADKPARVYIITDIKVVGQLRREVPGQQLVVEIDSDNNRATCTVKSEPPNEPTRQP